MRKQKEMCSNTKAGWIFGLAGAVMLFAISAANYASIPAQ